MNPGSDLAIKTRCRIFCSAYVTGKTLPFLNAIHMHSEPRPRLNALGDGFSDQPVRVYYGYLTWDRRPPATSSLSSCRLHQPYHGRPNDESAPVPTQRGAAIDIMV